MSYKIVQFGKERKVSNFKVAYSESTVKVSVTVKEISTIKDKHQVLVLSCNKRKGALS